MGDMADKTTEDGYDDWLDHINGDCDIDTPCQYCAEEEKLTLKRRIEIGHGNSDRQKRLRTDING